MSEADPSASKAPRPSVRPSFAENIYGVGAGNENAFPKTSVQMSSQLGGQSQLCESALAQRRAAYLPKLRELSANANVSVDQGTSKSEMGDISFVYSDCDSFANEMSEFYAYSELDEWAVNMELFMNYVNAKKLPRTWLAADAEEKRVFFADVVQRLESAAPSERLEGSRLLLYVLQGAYGDFEKPLSEMAADAFEEAKRFLKPQAEEGFKEEFCLLQAACNAYAAYENGLFRSLCCLYMTEFDDVGAADPLPPERGHSSLSQHSNARSVSSMDGESRPKKLFTLSDNENLRVVVSCLYHMVESLRRQDVLLKCAQLSGHSVSKLETLQKQFLQELAEPLEGTDKPLFIYLLDVIPPFARGACARYPIKKVVLLAWKVMLATLGDSEYLRQEKNRRRQALNLSIVEGTVEVASKLKATNFTNDEVLGLDVRRLGPGVVTKRARPAGSRAFRRQEGITSASALNTDEISEDAAREEGSPPAALPAPEPDPGEESVRKNEYFSKPMQVVMLQKNAEGQVEQTPLTSDSDTASAVEDSPQNGEMTPIASSPVPSVLPWSTKVKRSDVESFIQTARMKYFGYKLPGDDSSLFGLPAPVQQSVAAFRRHLYVSLCELQVEEDRQLNKYLFSSQEQVPETTTELLYVGMLPNLSSYAIGLLKVLLAAIPSSKAKNDSALILSDVLSRSTDANDMLSNSLNLEVSSAANMLEEAVLLAVDINRHKEIIVKACTAIIINLLKFFRLSHVYQFENFAQQLVLSNCLPLLLKFLDQNMVRYLQSKNEIAPLNYPRAPIHYVEHDNTWPKLNADNVEEGAADSHDYFMWRNVFSSVNLLRILNKLTKNKQSRTMMLVVFKSAPILKRCLKVRLGIFQVYTLKLLKMQARYLGRQWRRNNMEIISAVYMKVRHRLNDDWAFGNETRCKSWDFQMEERELKTSIEKFNCRRYSRIYPDLVHYSLDRSAGDGDDCVFQSPEPEQATDSLQSLLSVQPEFTPYFKRNYERWLEETVFGEPFDWDSILDRPLET